MSSLNKAMLIGRLGRDPELRYTQSGQAVCNFSMATDDSFTDKSGQKQDKTEWHNIVAWGKQAELCANYLSKGRLVYVEGSIQTRKWQDKDGHDRWTTEIKAMRVQFLDRGDDAPKQQPASTNKPRRDGGDSAMGPALPSEATGMDDVPF
jgi:single-strand DNA-binding protein